MTALVTIIVPIYNAQTFLAPCVDSLIAQTYPHLEFILVDDGSTDTSGAICDYYADRDPRVRVLHVENGGPSLARNLGLAVCHGDFVFFIDSDDTIPPHAISTMMASQLQTNADMVVGDFVKINQGERSPSGHDRAFLTDTLLDQRDIFVYVYECYLKKPNRFHLFVYIWGRLIRTSIIRENNLRFNEELFTCEDVSFNFEYIRFAKSILFLNQIILNKTVSSYDGSAFVSKHLLDNGMKLFGHMGAFQSMRSYLSDIAVKFDYEKTLGHAFVVYTIIQFVRICSTDLQYRWIPPPQRQAVYALMATVVDDPHLQNSLPAYCPTAGDSRILPWLMRLKWVRLMALVCRLKSRIRYKR